MSSRKRTADKVSAKTRKIDNDDDDDDDVDVDDKVKRDNSAADAAAADDDDVEIELNNAPASKRRNVSANTDNADNAADAAAEDNDGEDCARARCALSLRARVRADVCFLYFFSTGQSGIIEEIDLVNFMWYARVRRVCASFVLCVPTFFSVLAQPQTHDGDAWQAHQLSDGRERQRQERRAGRHHRRSCRQSKFYGPRCAARICFFRFFVLAREFLFFFLFHARFASRLSRRRVVQVICARGLE